MRHAPQGNGKSIRAETFVAEFFLKKNNPFS